MRPCGVIVLLAELFRAESNSQVYANVHEFLRKHHTSWKILVSLLLYVDTGPPACTCSKCVYTIEYVSSAHYVSSPTLLFVQTSCTGFKSSVVRVHLSHNIEQYRGYFLNNLCVRFCINYTAKCFFSSEDAQSMSYADNYS